MRNFWVLISNKDAKGTIVITGGTGFIGGVLIGKLIDQGYDVINVGRELSMTPDCRFITTTWEQVEVHLSKLNVQPLAIIHCSTDYARGRDDYSSAVYANIFLPTKILDIAIAAGIKRFINVDSYYTKNRNIFSKFSQYCITKNKFKDIGEEIACRRGISFITGRLEHVYGAGDKDKFIPWLVRSIKNNASEINLSDCNQLRDFIYVDDVANALIKMAIEVDRPPPANLEIEIGTGIEKSIKDFVQLLLLKSNCKNTKVFFGAISMADDEIMTSKSNTSAYDWMGWKASISLDEGLDKLLWNYHVD